MHARSRQRSAPSFSISPHTDGVPLDATPPRLYRLRKLVHKGKLIVSIDYDMTTGECTFDMTQPGVLVGTVFSGRCADHPSGAPFPLEPVQDPKDRRELLPLVISDAIGFGGINGYLVFPPGALLVDRGATPPIGFSGHFLYTTTYVPPVPVAYPSRWLFGGSGPTLERCIYQGTLKLGPVALY